MATEKRLVYASEVEEIFNYEVHTGATDLFDAFDSAIQNATTVDAAEVVHGRMVEVIPDHECPWYKVWECSVCGNRGEIWYNYCPNCGAKMDGGADNA